MVAVAQKKIGLIGGLSYVSTLIYYRRINELTQLKYGRSHSARIVLESLDFQPIADGLACDAEDFVISSVKTAANSLKMSGATQVAICCNSIHKFADQINEGLGVDLTNICECTASWCADLRLKRVGLLGSVFTTEGSFYSDALRKYGIEVVIPRSEDRQFIHQAIEVELCVNNILPESRRRFLTIALELISQGCDSLVLACTELSLLLQQSDFRVPVVDTVEVHCLAIVERSL